MESFVVLPPTETKLIFALDRTSCSKPVRRSTEASTEMSAVSPESPDPLMWAMMPLASNDAPFARDGVAGLGRDQLHRHRVPGFQRRLDDVGGHQPVILVEDRRSREAEAVALEDDVVDEISGALRPHVEVELRRNPDPLRPADARNDQPGLLEVECVVLALAAVGDQRGNRAAENLVEADPQALARRLVEDEPRRVLARADRLPLEADRLRHGDVGEHPVDLGLAVDVHFRRRDLGVNVGGTVCVPLDRGLAGDVGAVDDDFPVDVGIGDPRTKGKPHRDRGVGGAGKVRRRHPAPLQGEERLGVGNLAERARIARKRHLDPALGQAFERLVHGKGPGIHRDQSAGRSLHLAFLQIDPEGRTGEHGVSVGVDDRRQFAEGREGDVLQLHVEMQGAARHGRSRPVEQKSPREPRPRTGPRRPGRRSHARASTCVPAAR